MRAVPSKMTQAVYPSLPPRGASGGSATGSRAAMIAACWPARLLGLLWVWGCLLGAALGSSGVALAAPPDAREGTAAAGTAADDRTQPPASAEAELQPPARDDRERDGSEDGTVSTDVSGASPPEDTTALEATDNLDETPSVAVLEPPTESCAIDDPADVMHAVSESLKTIRAGGVSLIDCRVESAPLQGREIVATVVGGDPEYLFYLLETLAAEGYFIDIRATNEQTWTLRIRTTRTTDRGLRFRDVTAIALASKPNAATVRGMTLDRLSAIVALSPGDLFPSDVASRLADLGYRARFEAIASGEIRVYVSAARLIRRVRVHGAIPLAARDIRRTLGESARPGAVARGRCVPPAALPPIGSKRSRPPMCELDDLACRQWESDERGRIRRFLFESGYFAGDVELTLVCSPTSAREADLELFLEKGPPSRVAVAATNVRGAAGSPVSVADARWIRRAFTPRALLVLPRRPTIEFFKDARERVERTYAEPSTYGRLVFGTQRALPYPQVRVTPSFVVRRREEDLAACQAGLSSTSASNPAACTPTRLIAIEDVSADRPDTVPPDPRLRLDVQVQRGTGLETEYIAERNRSPRRTGAATGNDTAPESPVPSSSGRRVGADVTATSSLTFGKRQLDRQLAVFKRREPPSRAVARRESASLRAFYQQKGFPLARVEGTHDDFGGRERLRFEIDEGPRARIKELTFDNPLGVLPAVYERVAAAWIADRKLARGSRFSEAVLLEDVGLILAALAKEGYLCAAAAVDLAFFPEGFDKPGQYARLDANTLVAGGGTAAWLEQFDEAGLRGILEQNRISIYLRVRVQVGPRILTASDPTVVHLEGPIPVTRRVVDAPAVGDGAWGTTRVLAGTALRPPSGQDGGLPVSLDLREQARRDVVRNYRDNGYPVADAEVTWRWVQPEEDGGEIIDVPDTRGLADPRVGICRNPRFPEGSSVEVLPVVSVYEGKRGTFGTTSLRGNFKTRPWVLRRELDYATGDLYSATKIEQSVKAMQGTGTLVGARVADYPVACDRGSNGECVVHQVISVEESKDIAAALQYGAGAATLNPLYVFARPKFPNVGGSGVDVEVEGLWGFDLGRALAATEVCAGQRCYERRATISISKPRLAATPVNLEITGQYQRRATPARGQIDSAFSQLRFTWTANEHWAVYWGYLFQFANVSKDLVKPLSGGPGSIVVNRGEAVVSDLTGSLEAGAAWSRIDNAFNPHDGFIATMDLRLASPWLGGRDWWTSVNASWQHFIPIPRTDDRLDFRYSLRYGEAFPFSGPGADTKTIPEVWRFYGGGTADLGLRGILPETMLVDVEEIDLPYGGVLYRPRAIGGHIRLLGTVAFQVVSVESFLGGKLAHSIFYDTGFLAQRWSQLSLPRDLRHSVGVNFLKWDVNIVTLSLGYAVLLPVGDNVRPTDDRNGRFVFDVGITF